MPPIKAHHLGQDYTVEMLDSVDPHLLQKTLENLGYRIAIRVPTPESPGLSQREKEVLQGVAAGHPDKFIAAELGIRPRTVRYHLQRIMEKLGAQNRTSAAIKAQVYLDQAG